MRTTIAHIDPPRGYAPYIRGLCTAILLALAVPGITGWWPLLFIALLPLFSALGRLSIKQALYMGLFCGIFYHASLFYWILPVLQRFGGLHLATAALVLLLLAAYMAIYTTLFCLLLNSVLAKAQSRGNAATLLLLIAPILWTSLDFLRGILFTGLPWMDLGYALYRQPLLIQAADLGGHYLITFSVVMVNALLFWLLDRFLAARSSSLPVSDYHFGHPITVFLLLSCLGGYSVLRYQQIASETATADTVMVSTVQGNIEQHLKWSPAQKEKTVDRYLSLSLQVLGQEEKPELLVWPETALPFYPAREPLMNRIRAFQRKNEIRILTGSPYFTVNPKDQTRVFYYNSALLLNHSGRLA
ncbi:MAG: apolipoprotein N-acyltransferase, partial [Candidatus Electrothrix sp. AUS4]|nr:apolipoprotein N-acyltransferase [Candidatus Electrothrix sp. AUS4]